MQSTTFLFSAHSSTSQHDLDGFLFARIVLPYATRLCMKPQRCLLVRYLAFHLCQVYPNCCTFCLESPTHLAKFRSMFIACLSEGTRVVTMVVPSRLARRPLYPTSPLSVSIYEPGSRVVETYVGTPFEGPHRCCESLMRHVDWMNTCLG
jgi:hypothetical protein